SFRALHGCPALTFDSKLAEASQIWAEKLAKTGCMQHSVAEAYGENLAYKGSSGRAALTGEEATQMWYDEIKLHDFNCPAPQRSGHFTQVVWKKTSRAGFGRALSKDGHSLYVVGRYTPAGNYRGQYKENVPPIKNASA
ncbi:Cysteine-rich secretory protein-2, partial [Fasciolopsis buskii]